ncbi:MAG: hypothetical protein AAF967_14855, partial [Pseudomonadota bacterium]
MSADDPKRPSRHPAAHGDGCYTAQLKDAATSAQLLHTPPWGTILLASAALRALGLLPPPRSVPPMAPPACSLEVVGAAEG